MKTSKKVTISLLGFLLFIAMIPSQDKLNENIIVELSLDITTYYENQAVILNFKIKNTGTAFDSVKNLHSYGFVTHLRLTNQSGNRIPYNSIFISGPSTYTILAPDEEKNFIDDITRTYGSETQESNDIVNKIYLPTGKYSVGLSADTGYFGKNLKINELSFEIVTPTGLENEALNELKEIFKIKDLVERSLKYKDFALHHLESLYFEQTFSDYTSIGVSKDVRKYSDMIIKDCQWFMYLRPNSLYVPNILRGCIILHEKYKSKSETKTFLNTIISENPGTKAADEAKALLEKYK